jgi:hypothetical protein
MGSNLWLWRQGAGHGEAEEGLGYDVDLFVVNVVEHVLLVLLGDGLGA